MVNNRRIFFLHIPKTGGTTFTQCLRHRFGPIGYVREVVFEPDLTLQRAAAQLDKRSLERIGCVMGHFHYGLHQFYPGDYTYLAIFRDPFARVLSLYYHIRDRKEHPLHAAFHAQEISPENFFNAEFIADASNDMTRRFAGVPSASNITSDHFELARRRIDQGNVHVGILERFDESMALFSLMVPELGDLAYPALLNTKIRTASESADTESIRDMIQQNNFWDLKLFGYVKEKFEEQIKLHGNEWSKTLNSYLLRCEKLRKRRRRWGPVYGFSDRLRAKLHYEIRYRSIGGRIG